MPNIGPIDAIEQLVTRIDGSLATGHTTAPDRFSITPTLRLPLVALMATFDVLGAIAAAGFLSAPGQTGLEAVVVAVVCVFLAQMCGLYVVASSADIDRVTAGTVAFGAVVVSVAAVMALFGCGSASIWCATLDSSVGVGIALLGRLACAALVRRFSRTLTERVLLVGAREAGVCFSQRSRVQNERVRIVGHLAVGECESAAALIGRVREEVQSGSDLLSLFGLPLGRFDRVLILRTGLDDLRIAEITQCLEALSLPLYLVADAADVHRPAPVRTTSGWVLHSAPLRPEILLIKRALDLLLSAGVLILFAPLMLVTALLIRLESPGPALFRQIRLGRDNQPFTVLKFRTMRIDAAARDGSVQAVRGDHRVTRVGAFLRKTSIDELPQLLNVLHGTMSLVGPRPHPIELNRRFDPLIQSYSARHRIAPGITGWAQVNGFRGETRTVEQMRRRIELDLEYIDGHSVAFDLWILMRTPISVLATRNAY